MNYPENNWPVSIIQKIKIQIHVPILPRKKSHDPHKRVMTLLLLVLFFNRWNSNLLWYYMDLYGYHKYMLYANVIDACHRSMRFVMMREMWYNWLILIYFEYIPWHFTLHGLITKNKYFVLFITSTTTPSRSWNFWSPQASLLAGWAYYSRFSPFCSSASIKWNKKYFIPGPAKTSLS